MTYKITEVRISNYYEVRTQTYSDKRFNVDLLAWQGKKLRVYNRAFAISKQDADQEAKEQSNLFDAKIVEFFI